MGVGASLGRVSSPMDPAGNPEPDFLCLCMGFIWSSMYNLVKMATLFKDKLTGKPFTPIYRLLLRLERKELTES